MVRRENQYHSHMSEATFNRKQGETAILDTIKKNIINNLMATKRIFFYIFVKIKKWDIEC